MSKQVERTFSRTPNGLKNYNIFFNVDFMVYTEGRCHTGIPREDKKAYDSKYYTAIAKSFSKYEKIKVILVENKSDALSYHEKIIKNNINNSIVFIDKDYDGVFCSIIPQEKLLTTHGYSWENDFWTLALCTKIINNISMKDEQAVMLFHEKSSRCIHRLDKISILNAASHFFHVSIMPNSNAKNKGVHINCIKKWPVSKMEFNRIKSIFIQKTLPLSSAQCITFLRAQLSYPSIKFTSTIQGHLFENAMLLVLGECYKKALDRKTADHSMIKSIAFSLFDDDVRDCLSQDAIDHYIKEFHRA